MTRDSELELIDRLRSGDAAAFDIVYEEYNTKLFTFLSRLVRNRERAEDLVEDTWMRLISHAGRLQPGTRLGPWLFTVARNLFVSHCRSRMLEDACVSGGLGLWPVAAASSPFEATASSELERRLEVALAGLPSSYREVLLLVSVDDLDQRDAAAVCGISPAAFRQRLKRARDLLARRLDASARPLRAGLTEVMP